MLHANYQVQDVLSAAPSDALSVNTATAGVPTEGSLPPSASTSASVTAPDPLLASSPSARSSSLSSTHPGPSRGIVHTHMQLTSHPQHLHHHPPLHMQNSAENSGTSTPAMPTSSSPSPHDHHFVSSDSATSAGSVPKRIPSLTSIARARTASKLSTLRLDLVKTVAWLTFAAAVTGIVVLWKGHSRGVEFVTGYIVEYSLSVDNLFVFMLIFKYFRVPRDAQERVLRWGILGAMLLRGIMIFVGKALTDRFTWITAAFAFLLLYTAAKLLYEDDDDNENLDNNKIIRFSRRILPVADYSGDKFLVRRSNRLFATPLLVVLFSIELSDVVFATDSVPAVLGISNDPFVIYASNICAVMGLRSLYFLIADAISNVCYLRHALAIVLGFIGGKMLLALILHWEIDGLTSLFFVVGVLAAGVALSFLKTWRNSQAISDIENNIDTRPCD